MCAPPQDGRRYKKLRRQARTKRTVSAKGAGADAFGAASTSAAPREHHKYREGFSPDTREKKIGWWCMHPELQNPANHHLVSSR